jgi:hypothetical protein
MTLSQEERFIVQAVLMDRARAVKDTLAGLETRSDKRRTEVKENLAHYRSEAAIIEGLLKRMKGIEE